MDTQNPNPNALTDEMLDQASGGVVVLESARVASAEPTVLLREAATLTSVNAASAQDSSGDAQLTCVF